MQFVMNNERIDIDEQFALVNTLFDQAETKFDVTFRKHKESINAHKDKKDDIQVQQSK